MKLELKKYNGKEGIGQFRTMTLDEAKALSYGQHIWFQAIQGDARRAKVNGQPKTWKRSPERVEVSLKYGLYEYARFTERDIDQLLVEIGRDEQTLDGNAHDKNLCRYQG